MSVDKLVEASANHPWAIVAALFTLVLVLGGYTASEANDQIKANSNDIEALEKAPVVTFSQLKETLLEERQSAAKQLELEAGKDALHRQKSLAIQTNQQHLLEQTEQSVQEQATSLRSLAGSVSDQHRINEKLQELIAVSKRQMDRLESAVNEVQSKLHDQDVRKKYLKELRDNKTNVVPTL